MVVVFCSRLLRECFFFSFLDKETCLLVFLSRGVGEGFGAIDVRDPKAEKKKRQTSFFILTSACVIISLIACAVSLFHIKSIGPVPNRYRVNATIRTRFLAHFLRHPWKITICVNGES